MLGCNLPGRKNLVLVQTENGFTCGKEEDHKDNLYAHWKIDRLAMKGQNFEDVEWSQGLREIKMKL